MEYSTDENNRCPKCGLPFWDDHKSTAVPNLCKCRADNHKWGWECPRCGRVNAPWMPYCNCQITQTETQEQVTKEVVALKKRLALKYDPDPNQLEQLIDKSRHIKTGKFSYRKLGKLIGCTHTTAKSIVKRNGLEHLTV